MMLNWIEFRSRDGRNQITMSKIFIERRDDGKYTVTKQGADRASVVTDTQKEAIQEARQMFPEARPDVERQRDTDRGGRDKWRKT